MVCFVKVIEKYVLIQLVLYESSSSGTSLVCEWLKGQGVVQDNKSAIYKA